MLNDKITLIVKATVNPEEMESFNSYIARLTELFSKVEVKTIGHFPVKETFVGDEVPTFFGLYEFQSKKDFDAVYGTEEYKRKMIPLRNKGFKNLEVYLS